MKKKQQPAFTWRYWTVIVSLILVGLALVVRVTYLAVFDRAFLLSQGNARSVRVVSIPAYRGMITDRHGEPLAISTPVDAVWVNPQEFSTSPVQLIQLAKFLDEPASSIETRVKDNDSKEFIYLKRGVNPAIATQIMHLGIHGIALKREFRRYYPEGEVTAQLLGFTNIDDQGQEGLELAYNTWLQGVPGKRKVIKDRLGRVVSDVNVIREPVPGKNLELSIDRRIQYLAYRDLKATVEQFHAQSGTIVVLDSRTGEVLAMASQPSFNPNNRPAIMDGRFRNRAVTDVFEPGSTAKPLSVANALIQNPKLTPDSLIDTNPGYMVLNGHVVRDEHPSNNGIATITRILQKSSNVGVTKLTLDTPPNSLRDFLSKLGFGQRTDSNFPGEVPGSLPSPTKWAPFTLATLSFGYGMNVTDLQLAAAYQVLANGGVKMPISLLKLNTKPEGTRVMPAKVAHDVVKMMEAVLEKGGTATRANIPGFLVSGKTGTVRMVGPHGYEKNRHIAFFAGLAPASNPRLVIAIEVKDPQPAYYGGLVAAPLFAKVMGGALRLLDIPPDDLTPAERKDLPVMTISKNKPAKTPQTVAHATPQLVPKTIGVPAA